jgi:hypothetical protein
MYSHHSENGTNVADIPKRDAGDCLLEVDNWKLIKARFPLSTGLWSFPIHMCGGNPNGYGVHRGATTTNLPPHMRGEEFEERMRKREGTCVKCSARAPEEIMGLWTLHNWEVATQ